MPAVHHKAGSRVCYFCRLSAGRSNSLRITGHRIVFMSALQAVPLARFTTAPQALKLPSCLMTINRVGFELRFDSLPVRPAQISFDQQIDAVTWSPAATSISAPADGAPNPIFSRLPVKALEPKPAKAARPLPQETPAAMAPVSAPPSTSRTQSAAACRAGAALFIVGKPHRPG